MCIILHRPGVHAPDDPTLAIGLSIGECKGDEKEEEKGNVVTFCSKWTLFESEVRRGYGRNGEIWLMTIYLSIDGVGV